MAAEPSPARIALAAARREPWLIVLALVTGLAAAYGVARTVEPRYEATATLFVVPAKQASNPVLAFQQASLAQSLAGSYAELAKTRSVASEAARRLALPASAFAGPVETETRPGLYTVKITAAAGSGRDAARLANSVAAVLAGRVAQLGGSVQAHAGVRLVDPAAAPSLPTSPRLPFVLAVGGLVGALCGLGLALFAERRRRLRRGPRRRPRDRKEDLDIDDLGAAIAAHNLAKLARDETQRRADAGQLHAPARTAGPLTGVPRPGRAREAR